MVGSSPTVVQQVQTSAQEAPETLRNLRGSTYPSDFADACATIASSQREETFAKALEEDLENRVLPFDQAAAQAAGRIAAERRHAGRTVEIRDVQIAGIVSARRATLATHNARHFESCGLILVDPWSV